MNNYREKLEKKREGLIRIDKENDNDPYDSNLLSEYAGMKYGFNALMEQTVALAEALAICATREECRSYQCCASCGPIYQAEEALDSFKQWLESESK